MFGERAFLYAGPAAWNSLPADLRGIQGTVVFRRSLKTNCFHWLLTLSNILLTFVSYRIFIYQQPNTVKETNLYKHKIGTLKDYQA